MASESSGDESYTPIPELPLAGSKRHAKGSPTANSLVDSIEFKARCLFLPKSRFAAVCAHLNKKQGTVAMVTAFNVIFASHAALAHFSAVVESLLCSLPVSQCGDAPPPRELFCAISYACVLLRNCTVRKSKCEDVAPAIARLLFATQRIAAQDWAGLPSDADVARSGVSRDVLIAYLFQRPCGSAANSSAAQRLHECLSQSRTSWASAVSAVGRPRTMLPAPGGAARSGDSGRTSATAVMRGSLEIVLIDPAVRKLHLHDSDAAIASSRSGCSPELGKVTATQVEVTLSLDPTISAAIASFNERKYGTRTVEVTGGVLRFFLRDFIDGFDGDFTATVSATKRVRILFDICMIGANNAYGYLGELVKSGTLLAPVERVTRRSLPHTVVLLRNSDCGYGSFAPSGSVHGDTPGNVRLGDIPVAAMQALVPSHVIAAVITYLCRMITDPTKFTPYAPVCVVPAASTEAHVSRVTRGGAFTSSVVKVVAADGDPVNVAAPIFVWTADPIVMYESCMEATLTACDAAKAWFAEPPTTRAMLPHASAALFYRCVLLNDFIARLDNEVYCDVCTELFALNADNDVAFNTVGRHALAEDIPGSGGGGVSGGGGAGGGARVRGGHVSGGRGGHGVSGGGRGGAS